MAQERPNRVVEWYLAAKAHAPQLRRGAAEWLEHVREEPRLIWATPAVRYATYGVGGLLAAWIITTVIGLIQPAPSAAIKPMATTADFHVVCADPKCGYHFVIHRKFGFDDFPVECPRCKKETGMPARKCESPACNGRWVIPTNKDGVLNCPRCGAQFQ